MLEWHQKQGPFAFNFCFRHTLRMPCTHCASAHINLLSSVCSSYAFRAQTYFTITLSMSEAINQPSTNTANNQPTNQAIKHIRLLSLCSGSFAQIRLFRFVCSDLFCADCHLSDDDQEEATATTKTSRALCSELLLDLRLNTCGSL